jgi:hypothetical protein
MDTAKDPLESSIERAVVREANRFGAYVVKGKTPSRRGFPDRLLFFPGARLLFVETKRAGKKARPDQDLCHRKLRRRGFAVVVVDSIDQAKKVVRDFASGYGVDKKVRNLESR